MAIARSNLTEPGPAQLFWWILCVVATVACGGRPVQPSQIPLGQSFQLRSGQTAAVEGGLTVTFVAVKSDSRCPIDAICVSAGDAVVAIALSVPGDRAEREVHTNSGGSAVIFRDYSVKLNELTPYPRSDRTPRPDEYLATLTIGRL